MKIYYHPSIGSYATRVSFEREYALIGAEVGGVASGIYATKTVKARRGLYALAGALAGAGLGGLFGPKRILSWFNPPPYDPPRKYPKTIPEKVVPSFIGDKGQVLNLLMYDGEGDIVTDYSGLNNHAKIVNAKWVDGSFGWALAFDRSCVLASIPQIQNVPLNAFTFEAWVNYARDTGDIPQIFEAHTKGKGWEIYLEGKFPNLTFFITDDNGARRVVNTRLERLNTWYYIVARYDGSEQSLWVNGVKRASVAWSGTFTITTDISLGKDYEADIQWFAGLMSLVQIYIRGLSDSEIVHHFESTRAIFGV